MANHTVWIVVVLVVMLVAMFVKLNSLNGELNELGYHNKRLVQEEDICRKNLRRMMSEGELKRRTAARQLEDANRIAEKFRKELLKIREELQNKGNAYDFLQKILDQTKAGVEKKARELAKAEEAAQRYHNLYLAENMKLTSVSKAYEQLRLDMKVGRRPHVNQGESFMKVSGGATGPERSNVALTQTHAAEPRQLHSLAAGSPTKQEQDHKTKELQQQGQQERQQGQQERQQQQQERQQGQQERQQGQQERQQGEQERQQGEQQQQQQQQAEGNKEKGNEREKGRGEWNEVDAAEEKEGEKEGREKAMA